MKLEQITVDRNESGVYATAPVFIGGLTQVVTIWCKLGRYADKYLGKSDAEIKKLALADWQEFSRPAAAKLGSLGGSARTPAQAEAHRRSGGMGPAESHKKGGRPMGSKNKKPR